MKQKLTPWVVHLAQTVCIRRVNSDTPLARIFGPRSMAEANARLIVAATNAAKEINPENPIRAAESLPAIVRAAQKLYDWYEIDLEAFREKYGEDYIGSNTAPGDELLEILRRATIKEAA